MGLEELFLLGIVLVLPTLSLIDLSKDKSMKNHQIILTLLIILVPFFGPVAYLIYSRCVFFFGTKAQ